MSQTFWISLLLKEDEIRARFGYKTIKECLSEISVDERSGKGPFAVFPDSKEKCEPLKRGSYNDVRTYLREQGEIIERYPYVLWPWILNHYKDYSISVVGG